MAGGLEEAWGRLHLHRRWSQLRTTPLREKTAAHRRCKSSKREHGTTVDGVSFMNDSLAPRVDWMNFYINLCFFPDY